MEYPRKLYLINEDSESEKSSLQKTDISNLPFYELNFFSTHNSAIHDCQIGCNSNMDQIKRYLKFIEFFPICIELDLINTDNTDNGILIGHLTKNNMNQIYCYTVINSILNDIGTFYPLVIVCDNSTLYKRIKIPRNKEEEDNLATAMESVLERCKRIFDRDKMVPNKEMESSTPLSELMNKVLFRFKDKDNQANITEPMGVTKAINAGVLSEKINVQIKKIMVDEKITALKNKAIIRTYPKMSRGLFAFKEVKRRLSGGISSTGDNETLTQLNKDFSKHIFSPNHRINFFSFNSYSIEDPNMQKLIKKFANLYNNLNELPDTIDVSVGGNVENQNLVWNNRNINQQTLSTPPQNMDENFVQVKDTEIFRMLDLYEDDEMDDPLPPDPIPIVANNDPLPIGEKRVSKVGGSKKYKKKTKNKKTKNKNKKTKNKNKKKKKKKKTKKKKKKINLF